MPKFPGQVSGGAGFKLRNTWSSPRGFHHDIAAVLLSLVSLVVAQEAEYCLRHSLLKAGTVSVKV